MIILAVAAAALALGVTIAMIILAGRQSHERPGYLPDSAYLAHGYNDLDGRVGRRAGSSRVRAESQVFEHPVTGARLMAPKGALTGPPAGYRELAEHEIGGDAA